MRGMAEVSGIADADSERFGQLLLRFGILAVRVERPSIGVESGDILTDLDSLGGQDERLRRVELAIGVVIDERKRGLWITERLLLKIVERGARARQVAGFLKRDGKRVKIFRVWERSIALLEQRGCFGGTMLLDAQIG